MWDKPTRSIFSADTKRGELLCDRREVTTQKDELHATATFTLAAAIDSSITSVAALLLVALCDLLATLCTQRCSEKQ